MIKPQSVDAYIASFPKDIQRLLEEMRMTIRSVVPDAQEVISYSMPAFKLNGILVWYAAHTNHIGFYPRASAIESFQKELAKYKTSKGAVQFPIDQPLPLALVAKITKFRAQENMSRMLMKKK